MRLPEIPITLMASAKRSESEQTDTTYALWERWNDYGIGLFLQGDTRGALEAFGQVSVIAPGSPEGPINRARVHLAEGSLEEAESELIEAEKRHPGYIKTAYFRGEVLNGYGYYDDAIAEWMYVFETYPVRPCTVAFYWSDALPDGAIRGGSAVDGPRP